jgi:hypothetical protein
MRRAIQNSKESLKKLSEKYSVNEKTIAKWKKRDYVHDAPKRKVYTRPHGNKSIPPQYETIHLKIKRFSKKLK